MYNKKDGFTILVKYFKPSGKYYIETAFNIRVTDCGQPGHPSCYMNEVAEEIRQRRERGQLPGLLSGKWDGYILLECDEGFPVLILASE